MDNLFFWCFKLPLSLCIVALVVLIVAMVLHKRKATNLCICFLTWMTFSFLFPVVAERKNVIKKGWLSILLMLVSPAAIVTYIIVLTGFFGIEIGPSYRYDELKFKNKEDILSITELASFPDFEYEGNSFDIWSGIHTIRFMFNDEPSASFFEEIDSLIKDKDNVYWSSQDSYFEFSGSDKIPDYIYIYNRGWDGKYMIPPLGKMSDNVALSIFIGRKGFVCRYSEYANLPLDMLGNRDSISALSGVKFPAYENKNCCYYEVGPDYEEDWTIMLDEIPSKEFIQQIKNASNWTEWENKPGYYEFYHEVPMKSYDKIVINENSRVVKAAHGTY